MVRCCAFHETLLVSRADGLAGRGGFGNSEDASISSTGRLVAFRSDADDFSAADDNTFKNVFVRDTETGRTTLVSQAGGVGADASSFDPSLSADGRHGPSRLAPTPAKPSS